VDATDKVQKLIDENKDLSEGARTIVRRLLYNAGRFKEEPDYTMSEYSTTLGDAIRAWVAPKDDGSPSYLVVNELFSLVQWSDIGRALHREIVEEYAAQHPEQRVYLPSES
jgi:hypothetical protein